MKTNALLIPMIVLMAMTFFSCNQQEKITPEQAKEIAKEAYVYGFPMVVKYKTMYMYAVDENST